MACGQQNHYPLSYTREIAYLNKIKICKETKQKKNISLSCYCFVWPLVKELHSSTIKVLWIQEPSGWGAQQTLPLLWSNFIINTSQDKQAKKDVNFVLFYNYKNKNIDPLPRNGK